MGFLKRSIFGATALIFILMGGFGAQSNSMILQIGGVVGILLGVVVLYIFGKMAWRAMGCLPSIIVLIIIIIAILVIVFVVSQKKKEQKKVQNIAIFQNIYI